MHSLALTDSDIQILKTYVRLTHPFRFVIAHNACRVKVHMPPS